MANEVRYENLNWPVGSPVAGERLATNGYYTGQHKGTPTQDYAANNDAENQPYYVETNIVRYGTIMGDAEDDNFPEIDSDDDDDDPSDEETVSLTQNLEGCTSSVSDTSVAKGEELEITYTPDIGYTLQSGITVTIGGETATFSTDYTYGIDSEQLGSYTLNIPAANVTDDIVITIAAISGGK